MSDTGSPSIVLASKAHCGSAHSIHLNRPGVDVCAFVCVDSGLGTSENPWRQTLHILMAVTTISRRGTLDLIWKIPSGSAGLAPSLREKKKMAPMWGVEEPQLQPSTSALGFTRFSVGWHTARRVLISNFRITYLDKYLTFHDGA